MSAGSLGNENDSDFEINLAPIIDCFTVLITYLLVSASFISLSVLDVQVASVSDQPAQDQNPPTESQTLIIDLQANKTMNVIVTGKEPVHMPIPASANGHWDLAQLIAMVEGAKAKWPSIAEASVKADPTLEYREVVRIVEGLKKTMPKVFLGE